MSIGRIWPSETVEVRDPLSGIALRQLTNYRAHSHHFYFTNPGWYTTAENACSSPPIATTAPTYLASIWTAASSSS